MLAAGPWYEIPRPSERWAAAGGCRPGHAATRRRIMAAGRIGGAGRSAMVESAPPPTLVERDAELQLLERARRQAARGNGSAWVVCAEAGGGKTSLLRAA